jgi:hypothetical protein
MSAERIKRTRNPSVPAQLDSEKVEQEAILTIESPDSSAIGMVWKGIATRLLKPTETCMALAM